MLVQLAGATATRAASAIEPVQFEYRAPPGCPSEEQFLTAVRERLVHQRLATAGENGLRFVVTLTAEPKEAFARVDFIDSDGIPAFRTIRGKTCDEVMAGIALVSALACDAQAVEKRERENQQEEAQPSQAKPENSEGQPPRAEAEQHASPEPVQPVVPPSAVEVRLVDRSPVAVSPIRATERRVSYDVGLGAGYASHQGPSGALNFDAFVGVRRLVRDAAARASIWYFRSEARDTGKRARIRGYGLRLEGCPLPFGDTRWRLEPCIGLDAGVLAASGIRSAQLTETYTSVKGFGDVVLLTRLGLTVSGWLLLELQGELALSLVRSRYGFGESSSGSTVFQVPWLGGGVRGGVGFHFP